MLASADKSAALLRNFPESEKKYTFASMTKVSSPGANKRSVRVHLLDQIYDIVLTFTVTANDASCLSGYPTNETYEKLRHYKYSDDQIENILQQAACYIRDNRHQIS